MTKITLSVDDGCMSDIRIADLAERYEVPCVFYWPVEWTTLAFDNGYEPLSLLQAMMLSAKHEIGSHTITHRHLTSLETYDAKREISDSKIMLQGIFGKKITKFCPPRGYTDPTLTKYTLELYDSQRLTKGRNLVHLHPDSGANGNRPWQEAFDLAVASGEEDIELWGHSWEFDKFKMWEEIELFLKAQL